jgi:hypothetical protein
MYVCLDCGKTFKEPKQYKETLNLEYPYHTWMGCPVCAGGKYDITLQCEVCKKYAKEEYITTEDGHVYCSKCYKRHEIGQEN